MLSLFATLNVRLQDESVHIFFHTKNHCRLDNANWSGEHVSSTSDKNCRAPEKLTANATHTSIFLLNGSHVRPSHNVVAELLRNLRRLNRANPEFQGRRNRQAKVPCAHLVQARFPEVLI